MKHFSDGTRVSDEYLRALNLLPTVSDNYRKYPKEQNKEAQLNELLAQNGLGKALPEATVGKNPVDVDRAEGLILQLFGGDNSGLASVRSRDNAREASLRTAVQAERSNALTRELTNLEKMKQESEENLRKEQDRKDKAYIADSEYRKAKVAYEELLRTKGADNAETKSALVDLNLAARNLNSYSDITGKPEVNIMEEPTKPTATEPTATEPTVKSTDELSRAVNEHKRNWHKRKSGTFTNAERNSILEELNKLYAERNISESDKDMIDEIRKHVKGLSSKEKVAADGENVARLKKTMNEPGIIGKKARAELVDMGYTVKVSGKTGEYEAIK